MMSVGVIGHILILLTAIISTFNNAELLLHNTVINTYNLWGILSAVQAILSTYMVLYCRKNGFRFTMSMLSLEAVLLVIYMLVNQSIAGLSNVLALLSGMFMIFAIDRCIVKIREGKSEIVSMEQTDLLTKLPNRGALVSKAKSMIEKSQPFALAIVDIDDFKNINDSVGHDYGDKMLVEISRRWNSVRQENDFLSRIGGDEFAFIITGFGDVKEVSARAERYLYCFRDRFVINDRNFYNTASMGVALYPDNAQDFTHLLSYADTAMYKAKEKGKHRLCLFRKSQTDAVIENVNKEDFIRKAVQDERFKLMFQPQYSDCGNKLRGFEALIRILSEEGDILPPAEYIRLAEKLNIITDIDRWVMKNAPKTFKPALEVNSDLKLSINVSVSYLLDDFFLTDLEKFINDADVSPANIEIEITESLFISSFEQANKVLHSLRDMGVSVALDDFGTGYSSLSYLNSMPIDTLKIDKCFIDGLDDSKEREFVKEIIKIGHLLNFKIVSEGVEYNEQMESLDSFGCDIIQGYLLGRPETMEKAMDLVYDEICGQDKAAVN